MAFDRSINQGGFSLIEVFIAIAITFGTGAVVFQLFHQNERIFRDQLLIVEMQQAARMVASQIADDVRIAGQGVPPGMGSLVLPGSGSSRIHLRQGFSAVETQVTTFVPFTVILGVPVTLGVERTSGISAGRQIFVWNSALWLRATVLFVSGAARTVQLMPTQSTMSTLTFVTPPVMAPDEAVALFHDPETASVRRATSDNTTDPEHPVWTPANEVATNVTALSLFYFDQSGIPIDLESPADAERLWFVEARIQVRVSDPLSDGTRPSFGLSVRASPRNMQLR